MFRCCHSHLAHDHFSWILTSIFLSVSPVPRVRLLRHVRQDLAVPPWPKWWKHPAEADLSRRHPWRRPHRGGALRYVRCSETLDEACCLFLNVSIGSFPFVAATQVFFVISCDKRISFLCGAETNKCLRISVVFSKLLSCSICLHREAPDTTCAGYLPLSPGLRVLFAGIEMWDDCIDSGSSGIRTEECRLKTGELPSFCFSLSVFVLRSLLCLSLLLSFPLVLIPPTSSNPCAGVSSSGGARQFTAWDMPDVNLHRRVGSQCATYTSFFFNTWCCFLFHLILNRFDSPQVLHARYFWEIHIAKPLLRFRDYMGWNKQYLAWWRPCVVDTYVSVPCTWPETGWMCTLLLCGASGNMTRFCTTICLLPSSALVFFNQPVVAVGER